MSNQFTSDVVQSLGLIYEEMMWLSRRPNVTPSRARAWYTHIMAESLKCRIRRFTGKVSVKAISDTDQQLMLEHFHRIQTNLTKLIQRHILEKQNIPSEFIEMIYEYEQVHLVTRSENYAAMRAKGSYEVAGIELISWLEIPEHLRSVLWQQKLRGKVANADEYKPMQSSV